MSKLISTEGQVRTVTVSATSSELLSKTAKARVYAFVNNTSGADIYLRYGTEAATTSTGGYTVLVASGSVHEVPSIYRGAVQVIGTSGDVTVTELF
jgi:hypothetical protein